MSINTSTLFIQKATGITSVFYQGTEEEFKQSMASASLEIYTVNTLNELPYPGNINYVYRVKSEANLFQWNGSGYESLSYTESELNIQLIHGGTANGTNS